MRAAEADRSITVTENWMFDAGFYPVLSPSTSTNYWHCLLDAQLLSNAGYV